MTEERIELVIVFKKEIELDKALAILDGTGIKYRKGMDSSKGKIYFYSTGPKFILTFETNERKDAFITEYENKKEVYEIYAPDWAITKD
jgi:hypothetical protein